MQPTDHSVDEFLASVEHEVRKADGYVLREMMERITGRPAVMWGPTIIGFDRYHYKYDSGHEGDSFMVGFSPRKAKHSLYFMPGYGEYDDIVSRLGKCTSGKACLYVNKLADIDMSVLEELTATAIETMRKKYPA
ncbi:MAG: DUF1801 domain-containing protein [Parvularcula sp.]